MTGLTYNFIYILGTFFKLCAGRLAFFLLFILLPTR
jgi:hypothetical protein